MENFRQDLISEIRRIFNRLEIRYARNNEFDDFLLDYLTLCRKWIYSRPRRVFISQELKSKISSHPKGREIQSIAFKLSKGSDVTPHLSDKLFEHSNHDQMVYEWWIYHFHLSLDKKKQASYFFKRTNSLLFAFIRSDAAYLLDIDTHREGVFAEDKWFRILINNWPEMMDNYKRTDFRSSLGNLSAKDRQALWDKGYSLLFTEIDGVSFISPGIGRASSGHSNQAVEQKISIERWIIHYEKELAENGAGLKFAISQVHRISLNKIRFRAKISDVGFSIVEEQTGLVIATYP